MSGVIKQALKEAGFNDKEAAVYLAALSFHDGTLFQVARKANLKRTTVYGIVASLEERGILGTFQVRKGTRIRAVDPEVLAHQAEKRFVDIQAALPELLKIQQSDIHVPKVTFFKGIKGYQTVLEDTLEKHLVTLCFIGALNEIDEIISDEFDYHYYMPTRVKRKIRVKGLIFHEDVEKIRRRDHVRELRELRVMPEQYSFQTIKGIYQDKVAVFSSAQEMVCMLIQSESIADMERKLFEFVWERSTPLSEAIR